MRLIIVIVTVVVIITAVVSSSDLLEKVSFNPMGNTMEPKTRANDDDGIREYNLLQNENEPEWGAVNYGSVDMARETTVDENGTEGVSIDGEPTIKDMSANATAESKVPPFTKGVTIFGLPGVRGTKPVNSFSFSPSGNIMAPRDSYFKTETIKEKEGLPSKDISVYKVPYGGDAFEVADTTGISTNSKDSIAIAKQVNKTLDKLSEISKNEDRYQPYANLLFSKGGISQEFKNTNEILNNGRYSSSYKKGLLLALGEFKVNKPLLAGVAIKTDTGNQDVFGQFDYIHQYMKSGKSKEYSPELVKWAQKNADSILLVLMTNYMVQSQFSGTGGPYKTPTRLNNWNQSKLPWYGTLTYQGSKTKEPYYLYCNINPSAGSKKAKKGYLPVLKRSQVVPDLSFIFGTYAAITNQVWIGANGIHWKSSRATTFSNMVKDASRAASRNKTSKKNRPKNANYVSTNFEDYYSNPLVEALSTSKGAKDRTSQVYPNISLIGALRTVIPPGENFSQNPENLYIRDKAYKITSIPKTKYDGKGTPRVAWSKVSHANTFDWWKNAITYSPGLPLQPAVFRSHWESNSASYSYIMMPAMLGGTAFPKSMKVLVKELTKSADGKTNYKTVSLANRYVMVFNIKPNSDLTGKASDGLVVSRTGEVMGNASNKTKSVLLTGYNGGSSFNIVDYFKTVEKYKTYGDFSGIEIKNAEGKLEKLKYLNIFKDFFTVKKQDDLVSSGKVSYAKKFNKKDYKKGWKENKTKQSIDQTSPNYSKFFDKGKSEKKEEKDKGKDKDKDKKK